MKISTKGRYALRLLLDLAEHKNDGYIALKDIANRQNVSKKYLEQIIPILNRSDILSANRGYQGGYKLAKEPDQYKIGDILNHDPIECERAADCITLPLWKGLYKVIDDYLSSITLQDLLDNQRELYINNYVI